MWSAHEARPYRTTQRRAGPCVRAFRLAHSPATTVFATRSMLSSHSIGGVPSALRCCVNMNRVGSGHTHHGHRSAVERRRAVGIHEDVESVVLLRFFGTLTVLESILLPAPAAGTVFPGKGFEFRHDPSKRQPRSEDEQQMHVIGHDRCSVEIDVTRRAQLEQCRFDPRRLMRISENGFAMLGADCKEIAGTWNRYPCPAETSGFSGWVDHACVVRGGRSDGKRPNYTCGSRWSAHKARPYIQPHRSALNSAAIASTVKTHYVRGRDVKIRDGS